MIKKSIATACLLATAASAASSSDYNHLVQPPHGKPFAVQHTSNGIYTVEISEKEKPQARPTLSPTCTKLQFANSQTTTLTTVQIFKHLEEHKDATTGQVSHVDITDEVNWMNGLKARLPNLEVKVFEGWYRSQNNTLKGIGNEALARYIDIGEALGRGDSSMVKDDGSFQEFSPAVAVRMRARLQPGYVVEPSQSGTIDVLSLLCADRTIRTFKIEKRLISAEDKS